MVKACSPKEMGNAYTVELNYRHVKAQVPVHLHQLPPPWGLPLEPLPSPLNMQDPTWCLSHIPGNTEQAINEF